MPALAQAPPGPPNPPPPDPAFLQEVPGAKCEPESAYERAGWKKSASFQAGDACRRIRFSYGPIVVGHSDARINQAVAAVAAVLEGALRRLRAHDPRSAVDLVRDLTDSLSRQEVAEAYGLPPTSLTQAWLWRSSRSGPQ